MQTAFHHRLGLVGPALVLHNCNKVLGAGLVGEPHGRGVGQIDAVIVGALLHVLVRHLGVQHAHDPELVGPQLDGLAHRVAAVGRPAEVITNDADLLVVLDVHVLQAAPLGEGIVFHLGVVLVHTVNTGAVAVGRGAHLGGVVAEIDLGRDCGDELLVLIRDLIHILHRGGAGAVAPDLNGQGIRAQRRKAVPHALGHAVAQAHDNDDRHDTDDDAQHGQEGAEFVAPHILEGLTEGLNDHLFPSCSADSKFSVGWTMASGARESPS